MRQIQRLLRILCVVALLLSSFVQKGLAQQPASQTAESSSRAVPPATAPKASGTFFFVKWDYYFPKGSKQAAVQALVDEVPEFLKSRGVLLVSDPLRKSSHSVELFSVASLLSITKDVEASHLLYLTISARAKLQCFDLSGHMAWEVVAKGARAAGLPEHNMRTKMRHLKEQLEPRIGTECLEVVKAPQAVRPSAEVEGPH